MPLDPVNADVAQIYHRGSKLMSAGRLIARGLVLTARHAVVQDGVVDPTLLQVRLERDYDPTASAWPWRDSGCSVPWESEALDMALVAVDEARWGSLVPSIGVQPADARAGRTTRVEARGYPNASREDDKGRRLTPAQGTLTRAADTAPLVFGLDAAWVPANPHGSWPGMSGSIVLELDDPSDVLHAYGVVVEFHDNWPGRLRVAPLIRAFEDAAFRSLLEKAGGLPPAAGAPRLTSRARQALDDLPAEVQRQAFCLFDRESESRKFIDSLLLVKAGQKTSPADAVVCCSRDDTPPHFIDRLRFELRLHGVRPDHQPMGDLEYWRAPDQSAAVTMLALKADLFQALEEPLAAAGVLPDDSDGFITEDLLRAALPQAGATRFFYLDVLQPNSLDDQDVAELGAFYAMWQKATSDLRNPRAPNGRLPCGLIFVLHGVSEVPATLTEVFESVPVITLGSCDPRMLGLWPVALEKRIKDGRNRPAYASVVRWIQSVDGSTFAAPFRLRSLLLALRPPFYTDYQD